MYLNIKESACKKLVFLYIYSGDPKTGWSCPMIRICKWFGCHLTFTIWIPDSGQNLEWSHKIRTKIAQKGIHPTTESGILMVSHLNTRHQKVWISNVSVFEYLALTSWQDCNCLSLWILYLKSLTKIAIGLPNSFQKIKATFDSF